MKRKIQIIFFLLILAFGCIPKLTPPPGCEDTPAESNVPAITGGTTVDTINESAKETPGELPTKKVKEGEFVSFPNLKATDPDGDKIKYTFTPPLDENGKWQTKQGDAGEYRVTITANDGKNKVSQTVNIIVEATNRPPVIQKISEIKIKEGETVTLNPTITDPDGDDLTITYSGWMETNTRQAAFTDAGRHIVTVTINDGTHTVEETIVVMVQDVNRPPKLEQINDILVKEGDKITLRPVASDADGDRVTFKYSKPFDANGVWQTKKGEIGSYRVNVSASDGKEEVTIRFFIAVESVNLPPKIEIATVLTVKEGEIVTLYPAVTDAENDAIRITYSGWMNENSYKTDYDVSGVHTVTIKATDGKNTVEKIVSINVLDVNRPPVFGANAFE